MSTPENAPPTPPDPAAPEPLVPQPRRSRILVVGLTLCALALGVVAIAGMVRYTHRVESDLTHSTVGGTIKFLRDRAQAPDLKATDILGNTISTASLRGKVVLINFWTHTCIKSKRRPNATIANSARNSICSPSRKRPAPA